MTRPRGVATFHARRNCACRGHRFGRACVSSAASTDHRPDHERGERADAASRAAADLRRHRPARSAGARPRATRRAGMGSLPRSDALLGWRDRDPRHAGRPGGGLFLTRTAAHLGGTIGTQSAALQGIRAVRALAHRRVVRRPRHYRAEHHLRKARVAAADRLRRIRRVFGSCQVRPQFHELRVRHRSRADHRDLLQGQHPGQDRH